MHLFILEESSLLLLHLVILLISMQSFLDRSMHEFADLSNRLLVVTLLLRKLIDILLLPFRSSKDVFAMLDELLFVQVSFNFLLVRLSCFMVLRF